jgi:Flp pilus assembly protein TadB
MKEVHLSPVARQYKRFHSKMTQRLHRAGYDSPQAIWIYLASQILLPPLLMLLVAAREAASSDGSFSPTLISLAAAVLPAVLVNGRITSRISERKKAFTRSLYKIYRFLDLQLSAGIKMTDALSGLPGTVTDPLVHPVWLRFSALYELTLDLDAASDLVRKAFGGSDCEMLATHLRQCMQTGQAGRSLKRMEELLFSRFFSQMQQETKQIRTQLLITACLGLVPAIVSFLYPMIHEAAKALQSIFG